MSLQTWQRLSPLRRQRLDLAIVAWHSLKSRETHPDGEFDNQRWYPSEQEVQECCAYIRAPSLKWPYTLNKHCRSMQHVAARFECDLKFLRRRVREIRDTVPRPTYFMVDGSVTHNLQRATDSYEEVLRRDGSAAYAAEAKEPGKLPFASEELAKAVDQSLEDLLKEIEGLV